MRAFGRDNQWLIYGPWSHAFNQSQRYADQNYGPAAIFDLSSLYVRWFDHWLKGKDVQLDAIPKVQVFVTGSNQWRAMDNWPSKRSTELKLYLSSRQPIYGAESRGELSATPPRNSKPDRYVYDPAKVPPAGRMNFSSTTSVSFLPTETDVLVYQSAPLREAVELSGPAHLELWFSTSGRDTDFFALLMDVGEDGTMRALTGPGKMRMRYLSGWDKPSLLEPGRPYRATINLRPFAHRFDKGHRIGMILRSEWFPYFERNLNTGERIKDATRSIAVSQKIFHDKQHPSALRLRRLGMD
jgi:putative CocE/NonD family hydrolase